MDCVMLCEVLMLAEVARVVGGRTLANHLQEEVFGPLGMVDSTLGCATKRQRAREVAMNFAKTSSGSHFDHNSEYWRNLGAPWGVSCAR
eukprot:SAG31_NODE_806_length_11957_cov_2.232670_16_plen_89_part_00